MSRRFGRRDRLASLAERLTCVVLACLAASLVAAKAEAADGDLDPSFGADALGRTIVFFDQGGGDADTATVVRVDPSSGEVFLGGTVAHSSATYQPFGVARLGPDGSPDWSFGALGAGRLVGSYSGWALQPLAIHLDALGAPRLSGGAFPVAAGGASLFGSDVNSDGSGYSVVVRGLPLAGGGTAEAFVQDVTVDAAGRRLACGNTVVSGDNVAFVARLINTGDLDPTFGAGGLGWASTWIIDPAQGATWCEAVEVGRDGQILLLLRSLDFSTLQAFGVVERRVSNGTTIDPTFGGGGRVILDVRPGSQAELLTDLSVSDYGEILVVGYAQGPVTNSRSAILRLLPADGSSASSHEFYVEPSPAQTYTRFELTRAAFDPAGRLVAGGTFVEGTAPVEHHMAVVRFSSPFVFDSSFGTGGFRFVSFTGIPGFTRERADLEDMIIAPDGKILIAGQALYAPTGDNYDFAVARLESSALFIDGFETGDEGRWSNAVP